MYLESERITEKVSLCYQCNNTCVQVETSKLSENGKKVQCSNCKAVSYVIENKKSYS